MSPTGNTTNPLPTAATTAASAAAADSDPLANESTFLTLLVSQLQNQDPLNPVDSTQFVQQLTSYGQLEQLIGIHQNTTTLAASDTSTTTPAASTTSPTTGAL